MKATEKQKQAMRLYYLKNKERAFARHKANYDPEKKKEYNQKYFKEKHEQIKEQSLLYYRYNKEKVKERNYAYRKNNKERYRELCRRWRERNRHKVLAQRELNEAVRKGILKRLPCEKCGVENSQGHHTDYTKPLKVMWLCPQHHSDQHALEKQI